MKNQNLYKNCQLCPRACGVDRLRGEKGVCGAGSSPRIARAALHYWEEPCISGTRGSGAVFFSGCSLHCVFCQNEPIARGTAGKDISLERLTEIFLELQEKGANNINLVTPGHYVPHIIAAVEKAKAQGLKLPIIYNTGGYETVENIKRLEGIVDVYLPDFKYMDPVLAKEFSHAEDYPAVAKAALREMVRQKPKCLFYRECIENRNGNGSRNEDLSRDDFENRNAMENRCRTYMEYDDGLLIREGVIVRQLLLPGHVKDARAVVKYLHETYGSRIYLSMMSQYTPLPQVEEQPYQELCRRVTRREYERLLDYVMALGVEQAFIQEGQTAEESFIPDFFSGEGV